jgi:hypothetical protein
MEHPFGLRWPPGLDRGGLITGLLAIGLGALSLSSMGVENHREEAQRQIPCTRFRGQALKICSAVVKQAGVNTAAVRVSHPDGAVRTLVFRDGDFQGCQVDRHGCDGLRIQRAREDQLVLLRVGEERYEVPGTLISGG